MQQIGEEHNAEQRSKLQKNIYKLNIIAIYLYLHNTVHISHIIKY